MSILTLDYQSRPNQRPSRSGQRTLSLDHDELYTFTVADFTTLTSPTYADPEGDALEAVKITALPGTGQLLLSSVPISVNDEISSANIAAGNFEYQADPGTTAFYKDSATRFQVSDVGSSLFRTTSESIVFNVAEQENQAPATVGDGEMNLDYGETGVFTRAMFTTQTTPPYSDPEGDAALNLRIDSLPTLGDIQLSGVSVIANQIISFDDIDDGLLTYVPDLADTDGDLQGFTFSIADVGSSNFTS